MSIDRRIDMPCGACLRLLSLKAGSRYSPRMVLHLVKHGAGSLEGL